MRGFGQFTSNTVSERRRQPRARLLVAAWRTTTPRSTSPRTRRRAARFRSTRRSTSATTRPARRRSRTPTRPRSATGTTATSNLDNTAQFVPNGAGSLAGGTAEANTLAYYNFIAVAPGYGLARFRVKNLKAGEVRNITIHLPTNYASATQGATVTTDAPATGTNVTPNEPDRRQRGDEQHPELHADRHLRRAGERPLGRDRSSGTPAAASRSTGSASRRCSAAASWGSAPSTRTPAARTRWRANPTCDGSIEAGWTKIITGPVDSFPGANPRPGTQDESLRYFNASPQPQATHLKFVVTNNQCTGQPSFHGDQDLDPGNNAECRTGIRGRARCTRPRSRSSAAKPTVDGTLVTGSNPHRRDMRRGPAQPALSDLRAMLGAA